MGMHNDLSTTVGLVPEMHKQDVLDLSVATLRSSADSMIKCMSSTQRLGAVMELSRKSLTLLNINVFERKTMIFNEGFDEYTHGVRNNVSTMLSNVIRAFDQFPSKR